MVLIPRKIRRQRPTTIRKYQVLQVSSDTDRAELRPKQIEVLFDQSGAALIANVVAAAMLIVILWAITPHEVLIAWCAVLLIITAGRVHLIDRYRRAVIDGTERSYWLAWFIAGVMANGAFWGSSAWVLVPDNRMTLIGMTVLWACGLSAGSVAALSIVKGAFFSFAVPALIPFAAYLIIHGPLEASVLGGAMIMFFGFLTVNALRMHSTLINALRLQHENALLVLDLNREKVQVEELNRDLEDRVRQRTTEVVESNTNLKAEINERRALEAELQKSLDEKDVLMREVNHRVKNNFQIIVSLLHLQSRQTDERAVKLLFDECAARIKSISMVHDQLYGTRELTAISLDGYLRQLVQHISVINDRASRNISVKVTAPALIVGIDTAIFSGLIVNELLSNAFQHAFRGKDGGTVEVLLEVFNGDEINLIVKDDGVGLPRSIDPANSSTLGLELVNLFVSQISGTLMCERNSGTAFHIGFPFITRMLKRA